MWIGGTEANAHLVPPGQSRPSQPPRTPSPDTRRQVQFSCTPWILKSVLSPSRRRITSGLTPLNNDDQKLPAFPSLEDVERIILREKLGNTVPIFVELPSDLITPCMAYLRIAKVSRYSFLLESVVGGESLAQYSFIGAGKTHKSLHHSRLLIIHQDPFKVIKTGPNEEIQGDPMVALQKELSAHKFVKLPQVPTFTGGAIGYVAYDCIRHFEPKTARDDLADPLGIPEAVFMLVDTLLIYDHLFQSVKIVSHAFCPENSSKETLSFIYQAAVAKARRLAKVLLAAATPEVHQPPIELGNEAVSNVGKAGYETFVTKLKERIVAGDIIQAVPSQRLAKKTTLHPFNAYRHLRQVNPSPYMFFLDCGDLQIVGASPETLCKVEKNKVYNHAIAGTVRRGKTEEGESVWSSVLLLLTSSQRTNGWEHSCLVRKRIERSILCWLTLHGTTLIGFANPRQ